jgi:hypothetical protein
MTRRRFIADKEAYREDALPKKPFLNVSGDMSRAWLDEPSKAESKTRRKRNENRNQKPEA